MVGILHPIEGVVYCEPALARKFFNAGAWIDRTIGEALGATARTVPDKQAFVCDERSITFAELDQVTDRLGAALLSIGFASGDRVIFQMGTSVETAVGLLACYKVGVIPVCSIPQYREVEIGQLAAQSGAKGYFVQADLGDFDLVSFAKRMMQRQPVLQHLVVAGAASNPGGHRLEALIEDMPIERARPLLQGVRIGSEDVLAFQLSGGTTGTPKIIPRFHAEYLAHSAGWMQRFGIGRSDTLMWSLPLIHNAGQVYALIPTVLLGLTCVLMPKVDIPRMLKLIERHRVTQTISIGPIASQLIAYPDIKNHDLSSLRLFATMSRADALEAHIGRPCSNLFGITEGLVLACGPEDPAFARHRTQGASACSLDEIRLLHPQSEEPVKLGEMGELCFRGPSSLRGYFNLPEANRNAFTTDGFYRSGDMMTAHVVEGCTCYAFEGRLRDNVNRGGEKIGCEEVEAFVSMHPSVADAKLVAMPDPIYGEKGCVYLILRPGHQAPSVKELADLLVGKGLAKFKCPERVETIDAFPVTSVGKLDKAALRAMIAEKLMREAEVAAQDASDTPRKHS
ncbi:MAG: AMP-binding protein [Betaproteobacteria bacterium]|nr:AMP-binding protein [Betaproteobacteria bacterium]